MGKRTSCSTLGRLTPWEIADAFPKECKAILPREIKRVKKKLNPWLDNIERIKEDYPCDFLRGFFIKINYIFMPKKDRELYESLLDIKKVITIKRKMKKNREVILDKELAKKRPIQEFYSFEKMRVTRKNIVALCPFHIEKTPSFYIYKDDNAFHCFGCGAHGDVIDFVMKINDIDFKVALKYLLT